MRRCRAILQGALVFALAGQLVHAAVMLKTVSLPSAEGIIVGTAFSPDSSRIAIVRYVTGRGTSSTLHTIQIVDLKTSREVSQADIANGETVDLARRPHFLRYTPDGRYLLLATSGSDVLFMLDAVDLQIAKRIVLHPKAGQRKSLSGEGHLFFKGVVSLAVASNAQVFGVLTHDEDMKENEIFIGSFSSGQIIKNWSLGQGGILTELGESSLALSEDGLSTAVSLLPNGNNFPKDFNNLRLYKSNSGEMVRAIRTIGLIGQITLMPSDTVLVSRIDSPSFFSKKACFEKWSIATGVLTERFCDQGRNAGGALAVSTISDLVSGFASHIHKDFEGQVYAVSGRVDVWDMKSGNLLAYSEEIPRLVSYIQVSPDGHWLLADQTLLEIESNTKPQ